MLRDLGVTGVVGLLALLAGFGVLGYADPVVAGGVGLVVLGAALFVHAIVRALAVRMGMGDLL